MAFQSGPGLSSTAVYLQLLRRCQLENTHFLNLKEARLRRRSVTEGGAKSPDAQDDAAVSAAITATSNAGKGNGSCTAGKEEGTVRTHWAGQEDPLRQFRAAEREEPPAATPDEIPRLTFRERQVLELVAEGCKSADIAERLQLGRRTIETHRGKVMKKLGVHTAAAMVRAAMSHGLLRIG